MNINNILPYKIFNNKIETNNTYNFLQSNAKRPAGNGGQRSSTVGDSFAYANYSTEKLLKDRNLIIDEKNMSAVNELLKNEVPATRENILRMVDIRSKIDSIVGNMSIEAAVELNKTNAFTADIDKLSSAMKRITERLSQNSEYNENRNITEDKIEEAVKHVFGAEAGSGSPDAYDRKIIRQLLLEGIPVTLKNISTVRSCTDTIQSLGNISQDSIAITAGSGSGVTPQALIKAEMYAQSYARQEGLSEEQMSELESEISRILKNYGMEPTRENIDAAKALIRNRVDVTEKNIKRYMEIRVTVDELIKFSDAETGARLLKQDIRVETNDIVKLLDKIKADMLVQQKLRSEASESYSRLETSKLNSANIQHISNKELKAMEKEIVRLLETAKIEASQEHIGAAKALIRNNMDVTAENINKFVKMLRVFSEAENAGFVNTDAPIFQGSARISTSQINDVQQLLRSSGDAIKFLEGTGSRNFMQLEQLMSKIESIRSENYTAVAFLMRNELPVSIRNASIAFSMIKPGAGNYIDIKLDRNFDYTGIARSELNSIAGALEQNKLPVNEANISKAYGVQSSIHNVAAAAQEKEGRMLLQKLLADGVSVEDYEVFELEALMKTEGKPSQYTAEIILQKVSQLRGITDGHISLAMKHGIPMNIDKLSQLKLILENRTSLGKELRELEGLLGEENAAKIKEILPRTDLKELKNGKDISEIYNEIAEKIKVLEKEAVSWTPAARSELMRITGSVKENLELQNYLNQDQVYLQLPVVYHERPAHLQVFVNDRHKGKKELEEAENLDVVLNLETESLGLLDIRMNIRERSVGLGIKVENARQKRKLDAALEKLSERISKAGFKTRDITCEMRQEESIPAEKIDKPQPQIINKSNLNGRFEIRV